VIDVTAAVLIVAGTFFLAVSAIGLIRLPDFYSRAHAVAKSETVGLLLVLLGLAVHHRLGPGTVQLLLIAVLGGPPPAPAQPPRPPPAGGRGGARWGGGGGGAAAPPPPTTAMHALARAAVRIGVEPWTRSDR
jgi:multisubunit Na+/H+ antiporter MnhG subunit